MRSCLLGLAGLAALAALAALAGCGGGEAPSGSGDTADAGVNDAGSGGGGAAPVVHCSVTGAWAPAGSVTEGRYAAGSAALPDGRVLIAGGWDAKKKATVQSSIVFDPAGDIVSPGDALSGRRNFPAVAPIPGGLLFAGGFNDSVGSLTRADVYSVDQAMFAPTGQMKESRELFSATALPDGRVVVMGGLSAVGLKVRSSAEIYDPASGTFTPAGTLLHARFGQAALFVPSRGLVLVVGGKTIGPSGDVFVPEAEWYDPATETFSAAGALAHARDRATASFLPDGRVLIAGGSNAVDGPLASSEVFDPATGTFAGGPPMQTGRMAHTATTLADGKVVVTGGYSGATDPGASTGAAEIFDPVAMVFTQLPALASARHDHVAALLGGCGVLVAGGIRVDEQGTSTPLDLERIDLAPE